MNNNDNIVNFNGTNATDLFNFKAKLTGQTDDDGETDNAEIMVPLKYLSNFWRSLETPLVNPDVNLVLNCCASYIIVCTNVANQNVTFTITERKCSSSYFINSR